MDRLGEGIDRLMKLREKNSWNFKEVHPMADFEFTITESDSPWQILKDGLGLKQWLGG